MARTGYRTWTKGDRCAEDYDLRQKRAELARAIREGATPERIARRREVVGWAVDAVAQWEARYGREAAAA